MSILKPRSVKLNCEVQQLNEFYKHIEKILKELKQINFPSRLVDKNLTTMTAAFSSALDTAQISDTILLSPGAASFGIFKNEFDRGDQFVAAVKKLK